ncbi:hypothetical protein GZH49_20000 [Nocardia terpenica]|uniref:Uncharacterized protein n=1 Tax=Nocardia terpenica TaxID=455432 RepID=A0A291RU66_9NOCA|nr:hypothetical protein CRH09_36205 [Nocardia terpenica]
MGEIPEIREWLRRIATDAGASYRIERDQNPPYGWNLMNPTGTIVCTGPLDRLELWVIRRNIDQAQALTARAARAGYRLVREAYSCHKWTLLDEEHSEHIHSAMTLDQIEQWLNE